MTDFEDELDDPCEECGEEEAVEDGLCDDCLDELDEDDDE